MIGGQRLARGLLDWAQDERPVIDRFTMLPIGQYEDGGLTLAWPGFLVDAVEGAQRSYLDAAGVGVPDTADGRKWAGDLDALNAASIGPMGSVFGRASGLSSVHFGSKNARIYDPPSRPQRPFDADYPGGARADDTGRLTHTIDGDEIVPGAYVVGRRYAGLPDVRLGPEDVAAVAQRSLGAIPEAVTTGEIGRGLVGSFTRTAGADGPVFGVNVRRDLPPAQFDKVAAHEVAHGVDYLASGPRGIPDVGLKRELGQVYDALNNPNRSRDGLEPASWGKPARPQDFGYRGDDIAAEHMAEAIRAYMADPNYLKTVAPKTAARIREHVNSNPRLNRVIQFNANPGSAALPSLLGLSEPGGLLAQDEPDLPPLLASHTDEFRRPKPPPAFNLWPEYDWLEQFQDPNLFRDMPREMIPEKMRPPLDIPDRAPEFFEDNWRRRVTGLGRPRG